MATTVNRRISIYIDDSAAESALKKLRLNADALTKSIAAGQAAGKNMAAEIAKLDKAKAAIAALQTQIDSGLKPTFNQLRNQVQDLERELRKLPVGTQEFINKVKELERARAQFMAVGNEIRGVQTATNSLKIGFKEAFSLGGIMALAQGVIAGAANALKNFFGGAIDEAMQSEEAVARLQNKLTNLGKADAFDRLSDSADRMAKTFKFIDNDAVLEVFSQLIDYGKLTENQMQRLIPVIIDFATNARISIGEATKLIIGGLEGQGKALKQYGIDIKDAGTESERFSAIVNDLGDKVKGSGEAFGETFAGGMAAARQEMANLQEDIGNKMIPVLNKLLKGISDGLEGLGAFFRAVRKNASEGSLFNRPGVFETMNKETREIAGREFDEKTLQRQLDAFNKLTKEQKKKALADEEDIAKRAYATQIEAFNTKNTALQALEDKAIDKSLKKIAAYRAAIADDELVSNNSLKDPKAPKTPKTKTPPKIKDAKISKEIPLADGLGYIDQVKEEENILEKVREAVRQHRNQLAEEDDSQLRKDINKIKEFYKEKLKLTQQNAELTKQLEAFMQQEIADAVAEDARKKAEALAKYLAESNLRLLKMVEEFKADIADVLQRDKLAGLENDVTKAGGGKARLDAQIALLEEEKKNELDNANLTTAERERIELDYQNGINILRIDFEQSRMDAIMTYAQTALNIMGNVFEVLANNENADLARDRKVNDTKRQNLQRQLNAKLISQGQYNAQLDAMNAAQEAKEEALKKKQFERSKRLELAMAGIGIAQAIISTLSAKPGATDIISFGLTRTVQIALIAATGIAQLAAISSKKYAKGGLMDGPSHSDGGMPIINPTTGRKVAEIEGGEAILSRATVRNNPDLVSRLLHSSMNRGGETIRFPWESRTMQRIDFGGVTNTVRRVKKYETGGVFDGSDNGSAAAGINNELMLQMLIELRKPKRNYVVLTDITDSEAQLARIVDDASVGR